MLFLLLAAAVPVLWVGGDLVYALLMKSRYARWEAGIERDPDGVRRGCREYYVGQGDTAVLLIHGFADAPTLYQRMAPALAGEGFTCRVMRLPHFAMPMDDYRRTNAAQWREAVRSELRELRQRQARVVVVAHSLGAAVRPCAERLLHHYRLRPHPILAIRRISHDIKKSQVLDRREVDTVCGSDAGLSRAAENLSQDAV